MTVFIPLNHLYQLLCSCSAVHIVMEEEGEEEEEVINFSILYESVKL